jgi:hypothetical protein
METVSGVFDEEDEAVRAGERAREVVRTRSRVSVFLKRAGEVVAPMSSRTRRVFGVRPS